MNQADVFYRAFVDYRKLTAEDSKCKRLREAIASASADADKLKAIRSHCIIESDWVDRIYEGLPFIEKAIREERQFITQQGEVVPIEKAKRISKNSVEHLARHSDMITHEPKQGEDIVPDELYIVEKLSDYAVYENRFIYMLLCYLRDFIEIRYSKIIELGNTYRAYMEMDKTVKLGKRVIKCKIDFSEEAKNDPFDFFDGHTDVLLKRIEEERHIIAAFLLTPLMRMVSKSPMLKPPITRTNALKMNNNFKNALALYDYVASYTKDGYRIEYQEKTYNPFSKTMGDEFAEIVALNSFLVYEYGKELKVALKESYDQEEERRKAEADERHRLLLKQLKQRLEETGEGMEEYMLALENRNTELEGDRVRLKEAKEQIAELEASILDYRRRQNELLGEIDRLKDELFQKNEYIKRREEEFAREIAELKEAHEAEKKAIIEEWERKLTEQHDALRAEIKELNEKYTAEITELNEKHTTEITELNEKHTAQINEQNQRHTEEITQVRDSYEEILKAERAQFTAQITETSGELDRVTVENTELSQERMILKAKLRAQMQLNGTAPEDEDFTTRDNFEELEAEYVALKTLRDNEWKKAKKVIRGRLIWDRFFPQLFGGQNEGAQEDGDASSDKAEMAEATEISDKDKMAEAAEISDKDKMAESAEISDKEKMAEATEISDKDKMAEAAEISDKDKMAESAEISDKEKMAEAAEISDKEKMTSSEENSDKE